MAESMPAALAVLAEWTPAMLVSDIGMPGEDGYALVTKPIEPGELVNAVAGLAGAIGPGPVDRST